MLPSVRPPGWHVSENWRRWGGTKRSLLPVWPWCSAKAASPLTHCHVGGGFKPFCFLSHHSSTLLFSVFKSHFCLVLLFFSDIIWPFLFKLPALRLVYSSVAFECSTSIIFYAFIHHFSRKVPSRSPDLFFSRVLDHQAEYNTTQDILYNSNTPKMKNNSMLQWCHVRIKRDKISASAWFWNSRNDEP